MENDLKDHILQEGNNPVLSVLIDMVHARKNTGLPYRMGGLYDQPYFMMVYVEPWIDQAYQAFSDLKSMIAPNPQTYGESIVAFNTQLLLEGL